ncbi:SemiSWEET family sugar transporter [Terrihabitans sp. B22-R8]|uniref:SemiSWEET family sugar transporter n=1 Tax=Terrihabitans sp. B22-R8 TaxID=3425128 RepID=UPI00403CEA2D
MDVVSFVGLAAAVVTTSASVPQVLKCWKTRAAGDLSVRMLLVQTAGLILWALYGVMKGDPIIIVSNLIGAGLFGTLLVFKRIFRPPSSETKSQPAQ